MTGIEIVMIISLFLNVIIAGIGANFWLWGWKNKRLVELHEERAEYYRTKYDNLRVQRITAGDF